MSTLVVDTLTNQEPQLCKAWVNFNGTGTVAIRASYNVSSITDNRTGDYTMNFTNSFEDTNYCVVNGSGDTGASDRAGLLSPTSMTTSSFRGTAVSYNGGLLDRDTMMWAIFR